MLNITLLVILVTNIITLLDGETAQNLQTKYFLSPFTDYLPLLECTEVKSICGISPTTRRGANLGKAPVGHITVNALY